MNHIVHGIDLSEESVLRTIAEVLPETTLVERALIKGLGDGMRIAKRTPLPKESPQTKEESTEN
ncbi:MAG: hypothetical protein E7242_00935 [Lachnospiraceae bacterium]|nr:hypothetical protein [Lachnospiraceae bacterium]